MHKWRLPPSHKVLLLALSSFDALSYAPPPTLLTRLWAVGCACGLCLWAEGGGRRAEGRGLGGLGFVW